ncbi:tetratricopeptide repeat protein [Amnibacterium kyonggiense]|uniref:tetratricopeptide repeat protein n=1 Tax=Amnibacterium kyonggiense TaxID=595671 RepID=UPI00105D2699|nr:tetratricopeptide repeat protein [Amnibacterium kyonggiense]
MQEDVELRTLREAWSTARDGVTGTRYAEGLRAAGEIEAAIAVCREVAELGYFAGWYEWAWLEHGRGDVRRAIGLMEEVAELLDDDPDRAYALGVAGHWRWDDLSDVGSEPLLRVGMDAYPDARADLAHLLMATGRREEGLRVLADGVRDGQVACMLPLANILSEDGEKEAAEALYRRAFEAGDSYSAWNLAVLLWETGRGDEAEQWVWKAAEGGDDLAIGYLSDVDPSDLDR